MVETDLGEGTGFIADDDGRLGDVLEMYVLAPQRVAVALVDFNTDGRIADVGMDQGDVGLVFADSGVALAVERGIDQGELPGRGGFFGQNAVAAAIEMQVFGFVADHIDARQA